MDYSTLPAAKMVLEQVAKVPVPESEDEIRQKAYDFMLNRDFLAAHAIRFRKDWRQFSKEEWREVIRISGIDEVKGNIGALMACMSQGLAV